MKSNMVKILMDKHNMRLEEIAVAIDGSFNSIRGWLHGRAKPRLVFENKLKAILAEKEKQEAHQKNVARVIAADVKQEMVDLSEEVAFLKSLKKPGH